MAKRDDAPCDNPVIEMVRSKRGLAPRIAAVCGINPRTVQRWHQVPTHHMIAVSRLLKMPLHVIRPDIFPPPRVRRHNNGRPADVAA